LVASGSDRGRRRAVGLIAILATVALATPASASVLRGMTVKELRSGADAIVSGRVAGARAVSDGRTIETVVRVRVAARHKGETERVITMRLPGGVADGRRLVVPGAPQLERGEQVLLFLYRAGQEWRPVGLFQGVWMLDPADTDTARSSDSGGASLLRDSGATLAVDLDRRSVAQLVGGGR
jgi:hypothetical protein